MGSAIYSSAIDRDATGRASRPSHAVVDRTVTDEAESYNSSVAGISIEAVRGGRGVGPTQVLTATGERFVFTQSKIGFPMLSRATIPDDTVVVAYVRSAPPGSRWCQIDLEPGAVIAWSPAAAHTATNLPGLQFAFAAVNLRQVDEHANQLGIRIDPPSHGQVHQLPLTANTSLVGPAFSRFADIAATGACPSTASGDDVLSAVTRALRGRPRPTGRPA